MFTGLIEETGIIKQISPNRDGKEFSIQCSKILEDSQIGDSIAVSGVCLSITDITDIGITVQAVSETLSRSTLKNSIIGDIVNLERAMPGNGRFHGHIVQGHVDGVAKIISWKKFDNSSELKILVEDKIAKYLVEKGSITIDGISLTISGKEAQIISISVIPITLQDTGLGRKKTGNKVNIEVDILAKYVENFLKNKSQNEQLPSKLKKWGY